MSVLSIEHAYFCPEFNDEGAVLSYANELGPKLDNVVSLSDLTGSCYLYIHGPSAEQFIAAVFAAESLKVGECCYSALLLGDGALASAVLLMRTGDSEYVVLDVSSRASIALAWIYFVANIESDGESIYPELEIDDASDMLVPLLILGRQATNILSDYVAAEDALPREGKVKNILLDKILTVTARLPKADYPCYLVLVQQERAVSLFRSLLSFSEVEPHGLIMLREELARELDFFKVLSEEDRLEVPVQNLKSWELIRKASDFIGARALSVNNS